MRILLRSVEWGDFGQTGDFGQNAKFRIYLTSEGNMLTANQKCIFVMIKEPSGFNLINRMKMMSRDPVAQHTPKSVYVPVVICPQISSKIQFLENFV